MADSRATIQVVDDDDIIRDVLQEILERAGYTVIVAGSGSETLKQLSVNKVDLVLLDIKMPELDGFQTLELIREQSDVPVLMVSAMHDEYRISKALTIGADAYVTKPFNRRELLARVQAGLRRVKK